METVFIVAMLICAAVLVLSLRAPRKNLGFSITVVLLMACNVICILLISCQSIKLARNLLLAYYIVLSWMFLGALCAIVMMAALKNYFRGLAVMAGGCAFLTFLVIRSFEAPRFIEFSKKIFFGRIWWVAESFHDSSASLDFDTFYYFRIFLCLCIIACAIGCLLSSHRMFQGKYLMLIVLQSLILVMTILEHVWGLPVWILTLIMNPIAVIVYYYTFVQTDIRLRNEVIMTFANEMSDGLILYNGYNDLIHMNDLVKNLIDWDFLEKLKDISVMEEWISQVETVENIRVLPYKKGNENIYFRIRKLELGSDANPIGKVYILHDTTLTINQIRLMKTVNEELERTSRMKSDFLANMSHELRTPMNAVIGLTEIALRDEMTPRAKDCLNQINSSGRNLLNIINDILDYSKIDAGKMEIIPEEYEPLSEVNDIANILQTRVGEKDLELYYIVDPSLPHRLLGDSMRIRQVLINLANNAIKFSKKGTIRVTLDCERTSDEDVTLVFHVIDTGQGIKEEDLKKLFVSFTQVDSKRNRSVEGTGLGLAISKKLCEAMGGTIGVSSEYGKGSDFWFRIPQKIVDDGHDLVVEDADEKFAFCLNENILMTGQFTREMASLGVDSRVILSLDEYIATGKKEFLFIEENIYTDVVRAFLDGHPDVTGVVLTPFGSDMRPDRDNLRIMMRPQTTLSMVLTLNNRDISSMRFSSDDDRCAHFIAPDARILIVDDNSINLSIALGLLEPMKIQCDTAESGFEALDKVRENIYDIILMDHMMPGMDGVECTREIREKVPSAAETPIIALTANVMEGSKEMFLDAGMVDLIPKPIDVKQLNYKLYAWLPEYRIQHMDAEELDNLKKENSEAGDLYDCLDCERAIEGLGSAVLFKKIVEEYFRRGVRTLEEIEGALERGDIADYAIKTHALKSSSRQIGAMELGDLAEKLEKAGKAQDMESIEKYHAPAIETLNRLLTDLSKYFHTEEASDRDLPPAPEEEITSIFERLSRACEELDMDEMEACVEGLRGFSYPEDKKAVIDRLCEAVEQMDTDGCIAIMKEY